jgi:hypothetical protein
MLETSEGDAMMQRRNVLIEVKHGSTKVVSRTREKVIKEMKPVQVTKTTSSSSTTVTDI